MRNLANLFSTFYLLELSGADTADVLLPITFYAIGIAGLIGILACKPIGVFLYFGACIVNIIVCLFTVGDIGGAFGRAIAIIIQAILMLVLTHNGISAWEAIFSKQIKEDAGSDEKKDNEASETTLIDNQQ